MADTLMFLDLPPALGDATLVGYEGQIELESVDWGLSISHSMTGKSEVKMVPSACACPSSWTSPASTWPP